MTKLMLALILVPTLALAGEQTGAQSSAPAEDPMAKWVPPKVKNAAKDKAEIQALFRAMDVAGRTGDLDAAAALVDFPVTMITDDSQGQAMADTWDREKWVEMMRPFYAKPMKDMKITHKPDIFLLSDSLASVDDTVTMTMGGKTLTSRNTALLVRKDGKWRVKTMAEGGWGDVMAPHATGTASTSQPASEGTATGAQQPATEGTGTGTQQPATEGTGTGTQAPGSQTTTKQETTTTTERTTK